MHVYRIDGRINLINFTKNIEAYSPSEAKNKFMQNRNNVSTEFVTPEVKINSITRRF